MDLRDLLDQIAFRRGTIIRAVAALVIATIAWLSIQNLFFGGTPEVAEVELPIPGGPEGVAEPAPPPPPAPPVYPSILVATRDLQSGVMLVADIVDWREWRDPIDLERTILRDTVPIQSILGSVTRYSYKAGTPIAWDGVIIPGGPGFIGAVLEPGMRAITVEVDRATTNAGIIYPGDHVDVVLVTQDAEGSAIAQSIVLDVRVLAVGSNIVSMSRYATQRDLVTGELRQAAPGPIGDNYTLEVSPRDAERLTVATSAGSLTLAMRSVLAEPDYSRGFRSPVRLSEVLVEPPVELSEEPPAIRIVLGQWGQWGERVVYIGDVGGGGVATPSVPFGDGEAVLTETMASDI